jgi:anti-sigma regulatory factor (Ser/Thr protein kinase)
MIRGWTHRVFPIDDATRVGEARRHAARCIEGMHWSEEDAGRLAIVITELGINLHRHAREGRLLIAVRPGSSEVEVISMDKGPGMADLRLSMRDGHSSGSTPGTGLGAVRRMADGFDIHSSVPDGTIAVAHVRKGRQERALDHGSLWIGAVCVPAPGEEVSGDGWAAALDERGCTVMMADGLGHGPEAARASDAACDQFATDPRALPATHVSGIHRALQTTRGAALCVAEIDGATMNVEFCGAGNIAGRSFSGVSDRSFATQHGTAGMQIRKPETTRLEAPEHAVLVLHSDGIETRWKADELRPVMQRSPTLMAALLLRNHTRHRDDATVVVVRRTD